MGFCNIDFGKSAAEEEFSSTPELLISGYFNENGYLNKILEDNKFLVLGPKGAGKSAIGSKLELLSHERDDLFVNQILMEGFPYNYFSELIPQGKEAPEVKYPTNWEFLLLIALLDSYSKDPSRESTSMINFDEIIVALKNLNFLPSSDFSRIIGETKTKEFKIGLKDIASYSSICKKDAHFDIKALYNAIKDVAYSTKTKYQHLIVIDGLDDVLSKREKQYISISSLILSAYRINLKLKELNGKSKIVILCRTDLFDKLKNPNKNKIKSDSGLVLNWYQDVIDPKSTNLIKLVNLRAALSLEVDKIDLFDEFFPPKIENDQQSEKVLLSYTRHTPRDIIQLLNSIKEHTNGSKPTTSDISNGIRMYSLEYFVGEIGDNLTGFLEDDEIDATFQLLGAVGKDKFFINELENKIKEDTRFNSLDLIKILNVLYACSAIGNYNRNKKYYTYKYRNPYSEFDPMQHISIHKGLKKGLNIKYHNIPEKNKNF